MKIDPGAVACLDEAGEKGLVRNLNAARDDQIGLLASLVFRQEQISPCRATLDVAFGKFKIAAIGRLKKLHITEAFEAGNEDLRPIAEQVRSEVQATLVQNNIPIIYCARRMRILREGYERIQAIKSENLKNRKSQHIKFSNNPSEARVEEDLMLGLAFRLDAYAQDFKLPQIDIVTDDMDIPIHAYLSESIDQGRSIAEFQTVTKAYDINIKRQVSATISINVEGADFELDIKRVGSLTIVGKDDPLIFATDVVANSLHYHLKQLKQDARLNAPVSVEQWSLGKQVWGALPDASEDDYYLPTK